MGPLNPGVMTGGDVYHETLPENEWFVATGVLPKKGYERFNLDRSNGTFVVGLTGLECPVGCSLIAM